MKKIFLASIFCLFSSFVFAQGKYDNDFCANLEYHPPVMNFSSSYGKLEYDFTKSVAEVTALSKTTTDKKSKVGGLASCPAISYVRPKLVIEKVRGRNCLFTYSIDVFYGYEKPIIYIANDVEEGTCEFKHRLRHEQQHQAINILALEYFIPKIKEEMQKELLMVKPREVFSSKDAEEASKEMAAEYGKIVESYINKVRKVLKDWQKLLDNKENYRREHLVCLKRSNPNLHMYLTLDDDTEDYEIDY